MKRDEVSGSADVKGGGSRGFGECGLCLSELPSFPESRLDGELTLTLVRNSGKAVPLQEMRQVRLQRKPEGVR
jgi:hypothetical protein